MLTASGDRRHVHHSNNIGLIRLIFASLVVVAHAYVLTGIAMQEPLAVYTETFTLGSLGVDGFFLISGYLITQSMAHSRSQGEYLLKRMLRIYPAFIVAFVLGGLLAAWIRPGYPIEPWRSLFLFHPVDIKPAPGAEGFTANSPMWTIAYEFRCYLGVMLLAATGLLARRRSVLILAIGLWCLYIFIKIPQLWSIRAFKAPLPVDILIGNMLPTIRFFAVFAVGIVVYLYREAILPRLSWWIALLALAGIILTLPNQLIGESLFMVFAAAIIFWLAFRVDLGPLQTINDRWDISYGTYLYGWPIGNLLIWWRPDWAIGPFILVNLIGAWLLGAVSWFLLERYCNMKLLKTLMPGARHSGT